jgi:large subunit ribosomal protein L3
MSGQLGSKRRTTQNLEVVRIDSKRNLILSKGAIPGSTGSDIEIKPAIKVKVGK